MFSGPLKLLKELRSQLKEKYEVDGDILGIDDFEQPEGKFLGLFVRFTTEGLDWEADPKQVESLLSEYGLESKLR